MVAGMLNAFAKRVYKGTAKPVDDGEARSEAVNPIAEREGLCKSQAVREALTLFFNDELVKNIAPKGWSVPNKRYTKLTVGRWLGTAATNPNVAEEERLRVDSLANRSKATEIYKELVKRDAEYFERDVFCGGALIPDQRSQGLDTCETRLLVTVEYYLYNRLDPQKPSNVIIKVDPGVTVPEWVLKKTEKLLKDGHVHAPNYMFHRSPHPPPHHVKMVVDSAYSVHVKEGKLHHRLLVYFDGTFYRVVKYFPNTRDGRDAYLELFNSMVIRHLQNRKPVLDQFAQQKLRDPLDIRNDFDDIKRTNKLKFE